MKQETINLIKSMTEQGFLVIVDPEKLNDQDRVIIQVMAWKDGDNKAEATLTADDVKINVKIADLARDEWAKPTHKDAIDELKKQLNDVGYELSSEPIDLLQCDGRIFRAKIQGVACEGKIRVSDDIDYGVYLCNDQKDNAWNDVDKFGYRGAWFMRTDRPDFNKSITDFELLPEPRVIFTNCVGEVFTEEDIKDNILVYHYGYLSNMIYIGHISKIPVSRYAAVNNGTDIFRSKKSLLKYLYETCE